MCQSSADPKQGENQHFLHRYKKASTLQMLKVQWKAETRQKHTEKLYRVG
jgi:hypothetical protein